MWMLLACVGTRAPETPVEGTWDIRIVEGPWKDGDDVALAATGPRTLEGQWQGPAIVMVVWTQEGKLLLTSTFDGGRGWTAPKIVGEDLSGPLEVDMALGSPVILARRDGQLVRLDREDAWVETALGPADHAELAVVEGRPVVAWTTSEGLFVDGESVYEGTVCGPPALRSRENLFLEVSFRGDGVLRRQVEVIGDDGAFVWEDASFGQPVTCHQGAMAWNEGHLLYADAEGDGAVMFAHDGERATIRKTEPGWSVDHVGAAGGMVSWTAERDTEHRLLVEDVSLLTSSERRYVPGEPADAAGELWLPFRGLQATVAAYRPPPRLD